MNELLSLIDKLEIFLRPERWWNMSPERYKYYYFGLFLCLVLDLIFFVLKIIDVKLFMVFFGLVLVFWPLAITELQRAIRIYPKQLNYNPPKKHSAVREVFIENHLGVAVYDLGVLFDIGKARFEDIDIEIPEKCRVDENHFDSIGSNQIIILNMVRGGKKYKAVLKRLLRPGSYVELRVSSMADANIVVAHENHNLQGGQIVFNPSTGEVYTSPIPSKTLFGFGNKKIKTAKMSGIKPILMNE